MDTFTNGMIAGKGWEVKFTFTQHAAGTFPWIFRILFSTTVGCQVIDLTRTLKPFPKYPSPPGYIKLQNISVVHNKVAQSISCRTNFVPRRDRVALPLTLVLTADFLCAFFLARELPIKEMEKEEGTKTPNTSRTKAPKFNVLSERSSRTAEKSIATVLYEACNFKHSVNNVAITFSGAAQI